MANISSSHGYATTRPRESMFLAGKKWTSDSSERSTKETTWSEWVNLFAALIHLVCVVAGRPHRLKTMIEHYRYLLFLGETRKFTYNSIRAYDEHRRKNATGD